MICNWYREDDIASKSSVCVGIIALKIQNISLKKSMRVAYDFEQKEMLHLVYKQKGVNHTSRFVNVETWRTVPTCQVNLLKWQAHIILKGKIIWLEKKNKTAKRHIKLYF